MSASDNKEPDRKTFTPFGVSSAVWDEHVRKHWSTPEKREATKARMQQREAERRQRWVDAGYQIDWSEFDR